MSLFRTVLFLCLLPACAHLSPGGGGRESDQLWRTAHAAYENRDFPAASTLFGRLATDFPNTTEGREARFYLATLFLDPRNPGWDPEPAVRHLKVYLAADSADGDRKIYRRPEARTLLELATQLTLPASERIAGLRSDSRVDTTVVRVPQRGRVGTAEPAANGAEVERLRAQVAERDETIRALREEIRRIRNTLVPRRP